MRKGTVHGGMKTASGDEPGSTLGSGAGKGFLKANAEFSHCRLGCNTRELSFELGFAKHSGNEPFNEIKYMSRKLT